MKLTARQIKRLFRTGLEEEKFLFLEKIELPDELTSAIISDILKDDKLSDVTWYKLLEFYWPERPAPV